MSKYFGSCDCPMNSTPSYPANLMSAPRCPPTVLYPQIPVRGDLAHTDVLLPVGTIVPVKGPVYLPGVEQRIYRYDGWYTDASKNRVYDAALEGIFVNLPAEKCKQATDLGVCSDWFTTEEIAACQTLTLC